jgi:CBS domain-containing protein
LKADGHLVGIVTDRDIACRALANGKDPGRMTAKDVMTSKVVCCAPDDAISQAIKTMETKRIHRLPVTDSNHISARDRRETKMPTHALGDVASD